ncbi:MAG: isochorismate synthase [Chloroflexi bacterium]|nr:isochorismate synthase [Chloroflexota bacterium]
MAIRESTISQHYGRLLSCSVPCEGLGFERFLGSAAGGARYYWENRADQVAFAGAGTAVELMAWGPDRYDKIGAYARELFDGAHISGEGNPIAGPRLYGGFAFRHDFTPDNTWSIYSPAFFVLPHYQLVRCGGDCLDAAPAMWLTINTQIPPDEAPEPLIPALQEALRSKIAQLKVDEQPLDEDGRNRGLSIDYPMSYPTWERMIQDATARIRGGELRKVVLARAAELRFTKRIRLLPVLRNLALQYADCYRFLFEPRPQYAFYGASPELLASVRGRRFETMALAGSMDRGETDEADRRLGRALLDSAKERHEHRIVVDKMRQRLAPLTDSLEMPPPSLLKLSNIQHINTPIRGLLKHPTGVLPLVKALHPTPALGGDPRPQAMRLIRELEPIPRGWYGAPVGWIDSQLDGQFAVAIRSAVAQDSRVWIYAGAGIVADSIPQQEWAETELKFRPMLDAHHVMQE